MRHQLPLEIDNAGWAPGEVGKASDNQRRDLTPPASTGQCGQVLNLIRQIQPIVSLRLTVDCATRPGLIDEGA